MAIFEYLDLIETFDFLEFFKISVHFFLGWGKKKMSIIFCAQSRILISIPPWNLYLEKALQTNTHFQPNSNSIVCSLLSQNRNFLIMFIIKGCSITKSFFFTLAPSPKQFVANRYSEQKCSFQVDNTQDSDLAHFLGDRKTFWS